MFKCLMTLMTENSKTLIAREQAFCLQVSYFIRLSRCRVNSPKFTFKSFGRTAPSFSGIIQILRERILFRQACLLK